MNNEGCLGTLLTFFAVIILLSLGLWGYPQWNVYQSRLSGEAQLAEAESNRKIAIAEAEAKKESAEALAEAEIIRAKGVAEANKIIGDSLKQNEGYLRYLYIQSLSDADNKGNQVIYIPTEAGLPILEAGRK